MAEVYLGVGIDASGAQTGAAQYKNATDKVQSSAQKAANANAKFQQQLNYAKVALLAFGAVAARQVVSNITEYTSALSSAAAVTKATAAEMKQIEAVTRRLGATTMFSASQAAEGVKFLGMAGFETNEIIAALPATLDLAAAASLGMGQAADIASNIMSGFNIEASRMTEVADVLASVAASANTDVTQMGDAMKYVGPIANSLGISMQDTAAAVGVLSNAGIQGSMAGTGLKTALSGLLNPSKQAQQAIAELGLTVEQLNPQTHSLQEVIKTLANAGLDAEKAFTIFGQRGATAMIALTDNVPDLERLTKATNNASGEAARMAKIMKDNLGGDATELASRLSELALSIGDTGVTKALRAMIQSSTSAVDWFTNLLKATQENTAKMVLLRIAIESVSAAVLALMALKLAVWIAGITKATLLMSAAFLATPYGAVVLGIGLITAAIYGLYKTWQELPALIGKSGQELLVAINIIGAKVLIYVNHLLSTIWDMGLKWAADFGRNIKNAFITAWNGGLSSAKDELKNSMSSLLSDAISNLSIPENVMNQMIKDNFDIDIAGIAQSKLDDAHAGGILWGKELINGMLSVSKTDLLQSMTKFIPGISSIVSDQTASPILKPINSAVQPEAKSSTTEIEAQSKAFWNTTEAISSGVDELDDFTKLIGKLNLSLDQEKLRNQLLKEYGGDLQKANLELQIRNEAASAGVEIYSKEYNEIKRTITATKELNTANEQLANNAKKAKDEQQQWSQQLTYAFKDAIINSKNLSDALGNLANRLQNMLINKALDSLLGGLFGDGGGGVFAAAKGAAFSAGGVTAFASGGVVSSPTYFPMASNRTGLMGEAGPEAIMPLSRTSSGELGVKMIGSGGGQVVMSNTFNIDVSGGTKEENEDAANRVSAQIKNEMENMVMNIINKEQRPGGVLASTRR